MAWLLNSFENGIILVKKIFFAHKKALGESPHDPSCYILLMTCDYHSICYLNVYGNTSSDCRMTPKSPVRPQSPSDGPWYMCRRLSVSIAV